MVERRYNCSLLSVAPPAFCHPSPSVSRAASHRQSGAKTDAMRFAMQHGAVLRHRSINPRFFPIRQSRILTCLGVSFGGRSDRPNDYRYPTSKHATETIFQTLHISIAIAPIYDAIAAIQFRELGKTLSYQAIAHCFGVDRDTVSRRHRGCQAPRGSQPANSRLLNPQQESEPLLSGGWSRTKLGRSPMTCYNELNPCIALEGMANGSAEEVHVLAWQRHRSPNHQT
jgi:hypothetical protein